VTILLLAGLALRLIIAYVLYPGSGFETDIASFTAWAQTLVAHGPGAFYASAGFADYPPGYLFVLWLVGLLGNFGAGITGADPTSVVMALLKVPPIVADIAIGALLHRLARRWLGDRPGAERLALIAAALYVFNPVTWYDSALWGQVDSVGTLAMLAAIALLIEGHAEGATAMTVVAGLVKPQYGIVMLPLLGAVLLRRHLLRPGSGPQVSGGPAFFRAWAAQEQGAWRLVSSAAVGALVLLLLIAPFGLDLPGLLRRMAEAAGGYPWLSVNAYNPWALVAPEGYSSLAAGGGWSPDTVPLVGQIPGVVIGTALLALGFLVGVGQLLRRADRRSILLAAAFLSLAFFVLPTRAHERYLFPAFAFLPLLALQERRTLLATLLLALASFINLHAVLTIPLYGTPNVDDLAFGAEFRTFPLVAFSALVHAAVFALLLWRSAAVLLGRRGVFRAGARAAESRPSPPSPPAAPFGAVAPAPWLEEIGGGERRVSPEPGRDLGGEIASGLAARARGVLDARLGARLLRRDRSAALAGEGGGRIGRFDLLVALLIVLAALTLRGWRVGEPYDMHFDEVYHARTATEFLQDWRYGQPHAIYEFTHPHLAKYLMAAGIVAFGNDRVTGTAQLGFAVRDAVVETRWEGGGLAPRRVGDRLYVSGPGGVRVYDLADRGLVATITLGDGAQPGALAVDAGTHRLLIADLAGVVWAFETQALDDARAGADPSALGEAHRLGELGGPALTMSVDREGRELLAVLEGDRVAALALADGTWLAGATLAGAADVTSVQGGERLVVDAVQVTDPDTTAARLATILGDDAERIRALLTDGAGDIVIASSVAEDVRGEVQTAIDAGELPGARLETGELAAVAATEGLYLLDAATLVQVDLFPTASPATGLALVERVGEPTIYVAAGAQLERVEVGRDVAPVQLEAVWLPAAARDVLFDPGTKLVHVLGRTPDGAADTIYVVEPRANAVFADARLPATPVAWALDAQPERPSDDREELVTIAADGSLAVVDSGSNAFAWRFPGVIAGALMAGLVFLLGRLLVRRRSVALLAAGLLLVDGMAFAQSRIAMNDTYVGLFIVAAYTAFAAVWLGAWRGRSAVLIGLPLVGILLGLALAAKWVGIYAIGGIVLLVLLRSALGRIAALLAMIALTGVLGWLAMSSPGSSSPDALGTSVVALFAAAVTVVVLRRMGARMMTLGAGSVFAVAVVVALVLLKGNAVFFVIMVGLTLLLAVAIVLRPVRFTLDELRFAVLAPGVAGAALGLASIAFGSSLPAEGPLGAPTLLAGGLLLIGSGIAAYLVVALAARAGLGPLAPLPEPGDPETLLEPAAPAPQGWLLPGWRWGVPWLWALVCLTAIPLAVYVASYYPWVELGNRWTESLPAGNAGQTFLALQQSMYNYHNDLRATHAASSPWWAWPFDLKPVWFYLAGLGGGSTAIIYDAGNLVLFWVSVPAMAWTAWTAWRRRSTALALVVIGFACQWLPWSRIDRATFQYHYYTTLPFLVLAVGYFLAELWHGPSARTWLLARASVGVAIVAPALLWLLRAPLCAVSGVGQMNPGSQACGYVSEAFVLTERVAVSLLVLVVGALVFAWQARTLGSDADEDGAGSADRAAPRFPAGSGWVGLTVVATTVALALVQTRFTETPIVSAPIGDLAPTVAAAAILLPLAFAAWLALGARDPRRLAVGVVGAMGLWFVLFYPDIGALPLPTGLSRLFQTLPLPTYNYDFQFAVNTAAAVRTSVLSVESLALTAMVAFLVVAAMYATWSWRLASAADRAGSAPDETAPTA
jgi:Gpi18-like mannosyltransferase